MENPEIDYRRIGKRIKAARKLRGISQQTLAEIASCTPSYISYIETGVRSMSLDTFITIANSLEVSSDELLIDCLRNNITAVNREFTTILSDCTPAERRILADLIRSAKHTIRANGT